MGISGLLPFLEKASRRCNVAEFRGCTVAIDAYCWLHKGAFGCAEKLVRGEDTDGYVLYCLKYIKMLRSYDIRPILVFDGQHLPAKKGIEEKRKRARDSSRQKVGELLRIGKVEEARVYMKSCINITHKMALALIKECRENGIDCIVAPYEADAQLAYLSIKKYVDFVITEDSDLLLFGCDKVLFKMDIQGFGTLVDGSQIGLCMKLSQDKYDFNKFRYMCILSGCDYLESLPGIGIRKALKFISLTANPDIYSVLVKLPSYLKLPNIVVTDDYRERFMIADATFRHQIVFDPVKRELVPLHDPKTTGTNEEYCRDAGTFFDKRTAFQMAIGNIDPFTHEKYDNWAPDDVALPRTSIWSNQYRKQGPPKRKVEKSKLTEAVNMTNELKEVKLEEQTEYDTNLEAELKVYGMLRSDTKKRKIIDEGNGVKKQENSYETEQVDSMSLRSKDASIDEVDKETVNQKEIEVSVPFKKLKKLSKFEPTFINYEEVTTSRFFAGKKVTQSVPPNPGGDCDSLLSSIGDYTKKKTSLKLELMNDHKQNNNNVIDDEVDQDEADDEVNMPFAKFKRQIGKFDCYRGTSRFFAASISETPSDYVEEKCFVEATGEEGSCNSDIIEESPIEIVDEESSNFKKLSRFTITKKKCLIDFEKNISPIKRHSSELLESREMENDKNIVNLEKEISDTTCKEFSINSPVNNNECVVIEDESQDNLLASKYNDLPCSNIEGEVKKNSLSPIISNKRTLSYKKIGAAHKSRKKPPTSGRQMDLRSMFSNMKKT